MVERQGGGNAAGVIRMTPAANYPQNIQGFCIPRMVERPEPRHRAAVANYRQGDYVGGGVHSWLGPCA